MTATSLRTLVASRAGKRPLALLLDSMMLLLATWVANSLLLNRLHLPQAMEWGPYVAAIVLGLPTFSYFGLYRAIHRYSGLGALIDVAKAVGVFALLYAIALVVFELRGAPLRTLVLLQPTVALVLVACWRALVRLWFGRGGLRGVREPSQRVLIFGAGAAGRRLMAALQNSAEMKVVGLIDDDPTLQGNSINGVRIHGMADLPGIVARRQVTDVLLAVPSLSRTRRIEIIDALRQSAVHVRTLPGLIELARGKVQASDVRELDLEDLLGREPVRPVPELMSRHNSDKVILVTGAGGSIGSELCRQILQMGPSRMLLVDQSEYALYTVHQELSQRIAQATAPPCDLVPLLCSVRDEPRMVEIMHSLRPDTVYHAAAYKHVPLVEHNVVEGVRNNVIGTLVVARAAVKAQVSNFVFISTDKAVRPTNVMGATKRLAEMVLQALAADQGGSQTCFSMVRFGNVLGSSGSVVPLFRRQIRNGGPVTVTHPEVTRFFMTIPEAAQLVVQAGAMAQGGEVFLLDMGNSVRIADLARRMIELSGLTVRDAGNPTGDIEVVVSGLRPGEKLFEELLIGDNPLPTVHPRIMKARENYLPWSELQPRLSELVAFADCADHEAIRALLQRLVVGFEPTGAVVDWLYREGSDATDSSPIPAY